LADPTHLAAARRLRELLAAYRDHEDLISVGAYRRGSHPVVDAAIEMRDAIDRYLQQEIEQGSSIEEARDELMQAVSQPATSAGTGGAMAAAAAAQAAT